jgi:branched-chain amino acid transport system ATP-binding protein
MASLLRTVDLTVTYGGIRAVNELSIDLQRGQLVGLIGPNGAGKTTFIDALTGFVPTTGAVEFDGRDISTLAPHLRARTGLGRTWQSLELFDDLTVLENLQAAATRHTARRVLTDLIWPSRHRHVDAVDRAIEILQLESIVSKMPSQLSQGQRKLVGVARALAAEPKVVCMDEPAAGLDSEESLELGERLRAIVDGGTTIFLIDHDMGLVLGVCDDIYVIEFGTLIAHGPPSQIRTDEKVIGAYLGEKSRSALEEAKAVLAEETTR